MDASGSNLNITSVHKCVIGSCIWSRIWGMPQNPKMSFSGFIVIEVGVGLISVSKNTVCFYIWGVPATTWIWNQELDSFRSSKFINQVPGNSYIAPASESWGNRTILQVLHLCNYAKSPFVFSEWVFPL